MRRICTLVTLLILLDGCTGIDAKKANDFEIKISGLPEVNNKWQQGKITNIAVKVRNTIEIDADRSIEWSVITDAGNSIKGYGDTTTFSGVTVHENTVSKQTPAWIATT